MTWHIVEDYAREGVRLVEDDGSEVRLEGVAYMEWHTPRNEPATLTLHPLDGRLDEARAARAALMMRAGPHGIRVQVAEPDMVTFFGGPLHGRTVPMPSNPHLRHTYVHAELEDNFLADEVCASPVYRRHEYRLLRQVDHHGQWRWAFRHVDSWASPRARSPEPEPDPLGWHACAGCEVRWTGGRHCWSCGEEGDLAAAPLVGEHGY